MILLCPPSCFSTGCSLRPETPAAASCARCLTSADKEVWAVPT